MCYVMGASKSEMKRSRPDQMWSKMVEVYTSPTPC